jgi:hypothetical protein
VPVRQRTNPLAQVIHIQKSEFPLHVIWSISQRLRTHSIPIVVVPLRKDAGAAVVQCDLLNLFLSLGDEKTKIVVLRLSMSR